MTRWMWVFLFLAVPAFAAKGVKKHALEITLQATSEMAPEPLTTEGIWKVDPRELNPHRQRYALERHVELRDLVAVPLAGGKNFGVKTGPVISKTRIHVRGPGPWYSEITGFTCEAEPNFWFATREGTVKAAEAAAQAWQETLEDRKLLLTLMLERVKSPSPEIVTSVSERLFDRWVRDSEIEWMVRGRQKARMAEWRDYSAQAAKLKLCDDAEKREAAKSRLHPTWADLMEPPAPLKVDPGKTKLLARAPARRWNGLYSVRLTVDVGGKTLNGQFLIDSGAGMSVMSPVWLDSQGINPLLVTVPGQTPRKVSWAGGTGLAEVATVYEANLAGQVLPLKNFLLMETELFTPPDNVGSCCDGILGSDFLRAYSVELIPGPPAAVQLWPREGYAGGAEGDRWIEVASLPGGDLVSSSCALVNPSMRQPIVGARWDTGSDGPVVVHRPWVEIARKAPSSKNRLECGPLLVADGFPLDFPKPHETGEDSPLAAKVPGFNIGIEILGRGRTVFDVSHGRVWLGKDGLEKPVPVNTSGVKLSFRENAEGDRIVRVDSLDGAKSPGAKKLAKAGLKKGSLVTEVDSIPVEELDQWQLEQRLSGAYGPEITLQWQASKGVRKLAPLRVK